MRPILILALLCSGLLLTHCSKSKVTTAVTTKTINVDFRTLSVGEVRELLKGRWQLRRVTGGIAPIEHGVFHHPYLIFENDRLTLGNDSLGVYLDAPVTWAPAALFGSGYMMQTQTGDVQLVPWAIVNDTLQVQQYANDGVLYRYTR